MESKEVSRLTEHFSKMAQLEPREKIEFWYARELQECLGYSRWENFIEVIHKAIQSCENTGINHKTQFREVTKLSVIGNAAERPIKDYMLTRYACYLIAQNGDPKKPIIAFAQSYFAVQTRKQELIEERMRFNSRIEARERLREAETNLSRNIYERGVNEQGFGRIRSRGDRALFGGNTTKDMKNQYGIKENRPLADFLPTLTIAAKNLATEMTNHNTEEADLQGERAITQEHVQNNRSVRAMLGSRGIIPEELPPDEDIKKLERRVKTQEKKLSTTQQFMIEKKE